MLVLAACSSGGGPSRPDLATWRQRWDAARQLVPDASTFFGDGEQVCGDALGQLRTVREELSTTPLETLDASVEQWLTEAEGILLDCPHQRAEVTRRLRELDALGSQIDAALQDAAQGPEVESS